MIPGSIVFHENFYGALGKNKVVSCGYWTVLLRATVGISVFPTPDTDAHAVAAGSRRPVAACEDGGDVPGRREISITLT